MIRNKPLPFAEFVALMALMMSLVALSIDAMLPALPEIGQDLGVVRENSNQLIIAVLFVGMAGGQILYGPLSDSTGRRPAVFAGFGLYIIGCLLSLFSPSFSVMLTGRMLQGLGAAGPRSLTVAIIRDQYEGRAMAQVMSFVMVIFILVPVIAPSMGQGLLLVAHWRAIFGAYLVLATIALVWFALRQPETLAPARRIPFSLRRIFRAIRAILANRIALGYTITLGLIMGAFLGYLSSSQQILQVQYELGELFPLYFAILALALGSASFMNSRLVMRFGMRTLTGRSSMTLTGLSLVFLAVAYGLAGQPPLWLLMAYLLVSFFCIGILFGNLNALAMEPLGHVAGLGAAVVGSLSTLIAVPLGTVTGQSYNGTILPLLASFALLSTCAVLVMRWAETTETVSSAVEP
jgi:DHA1 family bicyclomycin/chloramphenicol resistance-like MFS transporter